MHAFAAFNGVSREVFYDNLATAVAEHDGRLVHFPPRFLAFAREYNFVPRACNPASGWEKGKVETRRHRIRAPDFWPLREFTELHDVNRQARQWLAEVANQRLHHETRQRPSDRFRADALRPLQVIPYDYRDTAEALVHRDLRLQDWPRTKTPWLYLSSDKATFASSLRVTTAAASHIALSDAGSR